MSFAVESPHFHAAQAWAASWMPSEMIRKPRLIAPTVSLWVSGAMRARKMTGSWRGWAAIPAAEPVLHGRRRNAL